MYLLEDILEKKTDRAFLQYDFLTRNFTKWKTFRRIENFYLGMLIYNKKRWTEI